MRSNKDQILSFTYRQEGGFSNDAHDPGGATNYGITQAEFDAYNDLQGQPKISVRRITREQADDIYTRYYWNKVHGDELPSGIDLVIYDYAVNSGVYRAVRYAQWVAGVTVDGKLGPITLRALTAADPKTFIIEFDRRRLSFLSSLNIFQYFGKGWTRRVREATDAALKLIGETKKPERTKSMWFDVVLGIARHVITGSGAGVAALSGFDLHSPQTYIGLATFVGGAVFSAIDKVNRSGHFSAMDVIQETLDEINNKLDGKP